MVYTESPGFSRGENVNEENLNKLDKMIQDETEFEYQMKIQTAQAEREMYELAYESSPQKQEDEDFAKLI